MARYWLRHGQAMDCKARGDAAGMYRTWFSLYEDVKGSDLVWSDGVSHRELTLYTPKNTMFDFLCPYYLKSSAAQHEAAWTLLALARSDIPAELSFLADALEGEVLFRDGKAPEAVAKLDAAYAGLVSLGPAYAAPLRLDAPLEGIFRAGNSESSNSITHMGFNRFCYDFYGSDADGRLCTGDGSRNTDYHGFGASVHSPVDGVVMEVRDSEPDQEPSPSPRGGSNHVFISSGGRIYNYQHLQQGSVTVKAGDSVRAGQVIGRLGNSGSSVAHLHFGVYTEHWFVSLPVLFARYELRSGGSVRDVEDGCPGGRDGHEIVKF